VSEFDPALSFARALDDADELAGLRREFHLPAGPDGRAAAYFAGHSLGLQPVAARAAVERELDAWARLGVDGHFKAGSPWYTAHEPLRDPLARLAGAQAHEVVAMNSLTVNLHLMLVTFFRPSPERFKILVEEGAFPSDNYAVRTQLRLCGIDPERGLAVCRTSAGGAVRTEDVLALLAEQGREIALVLLPVVSHLTGEVLDLARIARAAREEGAVVGADLAHAMGNVELALHDWDVDFAVWCSYKYLNGGPGAVGGCFIHERHARRTGLPRLGGWWGNDPATRFRMHLQPAFEPCPSADGWQLSNPPILSLAPLAASLAQFDAARMPRLRAKSRRLTGYLERWVAHAAPGRVESLGSGDPERRGCQLSLRVGEQARDLHQALAAAGVVVDFREPDVIRAAPVPLYNSFHDVWRFGRALAGWAGGRAWN